MPPALTRISTRVSDMVGFKGALAHRHNWWPRPPTSRNLSPSLLFGESLTASVVVSFPLEGSKTRLRGLTSPRSTSHSQGPPLVASQALARRDATHRLRPSPTPRRPPSLSKPLEEPLEPLSPAHRATTPNTAPPGSTGCAHGGHASPRRATGRKPTPPPRAGPARRGRGGG